MTRTDVLVIGAGPAGMAAAAAAAEQGCRVEVLDDNAGPGGQIWRGGVDSETGVETGPKTGSETGRRRENREGRERRRAVERLQRSGARVRGAHRVFEVERPGQLLALRQGPDGAVAERFAYEQLVLATGARERFLPFPGWTLPGVFGAGGLQALVKGGYDVRGKRVVVAGSGPLLLAVAAHLAEYGATVVTVAEQAGLRQLLPFGLSLWSQPGKLWQGAGYRAKLRRTRYRTGWWPVRANGSGGQLQSVTLSDGQRQKQVRCELLACGFHLVPNTELAALLGCAFRGAFVQVDAQQRTSLPGVFCVGEPTGIAGLGAALAQGETAGLACAGRRPPASLRRRAAAEQAFGERLERAFALRTELRGLAGPETIVCRCEDVPLGRLKEYTGWTDAKLQTRCGMGPCQGRICGPAVETLLGWKPASVRQPLFPVPVEAFCVSEGATEETEAMEESA